MKLNGDLIMDEQKEQNNIRNKKSLIECKGVDVFYGDKQALFGINLDIGEKEVTSLIGLLVVESLLFLDASIE